MTLRKPFSSFWWLALLISAGLFGLTGTAQAVKYQVSILDPDNWVKDPWLNNQGEIVWCDKKQGDTTYKNYQIFYYDARQGGSPRVISLMEKENTLPQINDQGQVIWLAKVTESDNDLYYWDARLGGSAKNLSERPNLEDRNPRLNQQGKVVWQGWDGQD